MNDTDPPPSDQLPILNNDPPESRESLITKLNEPLCDAPARPEIHNFVSFNTRPIEETKEAEEKQEPDENE